MGFTIGKPSGNSGAPAPSQAPAPTGGAPVSNSAFKIGKADGGVSSKPEHHGLLGGIVHSVEHGLGETAHVVAKTGSGLATDIIDAPAGAVHAGEALVHDVKHPQPWSALIHPGRDKSETAQLGKAMGKGVAHSFEHPLDKPDQTLLNAFAVLSAGAGSVARLGVASDAIRAGKLPEAAKALATKAPTKARVVKVNDARYSLHPSSNHVVRAAQAIHDRVVGARAASHPEGRVAAYWSWRLKNAGAETDRFVHSLRQAPSNLLARKGKKLSEPEQAALRLTSHNLTPQEQIALHEHQLGKAAQEPHYEAHRHQIDVMSQVEKKGLVKLEGDHVVIDASKHPELAAIDNIAASSQALRDEILADTGEFSHEQLAERRNAPREVVTNARPLSEHPARQALAQLKGEGFRAPRDVPVAMHDLQNRLETNLEQQRAVTAQHAGETSPPPASAEAPYAKSTPEHPNLLPLKAEESTLRTQLDQLTRHQDAQAELHASVDSRPGRGYLNANEYQAPAKSTHAARSQAKRLAKVQNVASKAPYQGLNELNAAVPKNVTNVIVRQTKAALKKLNTLEFRKRLAAAGTADKRTMRDVLVNTQELSKPLPDELRAAMGEKVHTPSEQVRGEQVHEENAGGGGWEKLRQRLFEHDDHGNGIDMPVGAAAPKGWKWVDSSLVGHEMLNPAEFGGRFSGIGSMTDRLNAATTFFTVYLKPAHIITRGGTNAMLNLMQGSLLHPGTIAQSFRVWRNLDEMDKARLDAVVGVHGAEAPLQALSGKALEPGSIVLARKGAAWWARNSDRPFRVNGLMHELRKAGYRSTADVRRFLNEVEHMNDLPDAEFAKVDRTLKNANRWNIAYDRLSPWELRHLARYFWFYPWTAGSTRYLGHLIQEGPVRAAGIAALGNQGREVIEKATGGTPLPSYMRGSFPIGGDKWLNLNTASPLATPAEMIESGVHVNRPTESESLGGQLSPVGSAVAAFLTGQGVSRKSGRVGTAAGAFVNPTPEAAIWRLLHGGGGDQSNRVYPTKRTWEELLREIALGSARPRNVDLYNAARVASRERSG